MSGRILLDLLNHTAGFKKFGNLQLESQLPNERFDDLVVQPEGVVTKLVDLISVENLQSFHDFDLVSENYIMDLKNHSQMS